MLKVIPNNEVLPENSFHFSSISASLHSSTIGEGGGRGEKYRNDDYEEISLDHLLENFSNENLTIPTIVSSKSNTGANNSNNSSMKVFPAIISSNVPLQVTKSFPIGNYEKISKKRSITTSQQSSRGNSMLEIPNNINLGDMMRGHPGQHEKRDLVVVDMSSSLPTLKSNKRVKLENSLSVSQGVRPSFLPVITTMKGLKGNAFLFSSPCSDLNHLILKISTHFLGTKKVYFQFVESQASFYVYYMKSSYFIRMKINLMELATNNHGAVLSTSPMTISYVLEGVLEEGHKELFYELFHSLKDHLLLAANPNHMTETDEILDLNDPLSCLPAVSYDPQENVIDELPLNFYSLTINSNSSNNEKTTNPNVTSNVGKSGSPNYQFYLKNQKILSQWLTIIETTKSINYEEKLQAIQTFYNLTMNRRDKQMLTLLEDLGIISSLLISFEEEFTSSCYYCNCSNWTAVGNNKNGKLTATTGTIPFSQGYNQHRRDYQYFLLLTLSNFMSQEKSLKILANHNQLVHYLAVMVKSTSFSSRSVNGQGGLNLEKENCFRALEFIPIQESCHLLLSKIQEFLSRSSSSLNLFSTENKSLKTHSIPEEAAKSFIFESRETQLSLSTLIPAECT